MANYIAPKLSSRIIPVTRGTDRVFSIKRKTAKGLAQNWDCDVYMDIDIDKVTPTRITAAVANDVAVVRIESDIADQCKNGTTWRVVMSQTTPGGPTLETPLLIGILERNDGR